MKGEGSCRRLTLVRKGRDPQKQSKVPQEANPQKRGVCTRVYTTTEKPNSAFAR